MLQASSQLAAEVSKVTDFLEATREKKKWSEETVRSLQTQLRTAHKRMLEVKKAYESRAREEIQANQLYHQEVSRSGRDSSVAERAHSRHAKVRRDLVNYNFQTDKIEKYFPTSDEKQDTERQRVYSSGFQIVSSLEQSEELYRQAVEAVEEVRLSWLAETETCAGLFEDLSTSRLKVLRDSAWLSSNIGSAACVLDDSVYEESRQVLETAYSDLGGVLQDWVRTERTGEESPGPVICQWAATSSSLGVSGHLRSLRAGQQLSYDTASLGRTEASQSWPHLADLGRSRSDLGQAVPLQPHKQQQTTPAVLRSPKKPPRMFQYKNNNNNSISSVSSKKSLRSLNVPISKLTVLFTVDSPSLTMLKVLRTENITEEEEEEEEEESPALTTTPTCLCPTTLPGPDQPADRPW